MTEPFTSAGPDDRGLFTATTRYRAAGVDRVLELNSTQLSRPAAMEKLREQFTSASADNPSHIRVTIVQDTASGSVAVLDLEGDPTTVRDRIDASPSRGVGDQPRRAPWEVAAGPLTAPVDAPQPTAGQPHSGIDQSLTGRAHATFTDRGVRR